MRFCEMVLLTELGPYAPRRNHGCRLWCLPDRPHYGCSEKMTPSRWGGVNGHLRSIPMRLSAIVLSFVAALLPRYRSEVAADDVVLYLCFGWAGFSRIPPLLGIARRPVQSVPIRLPYDAIPGHTRRGAFWIGRRRHDSWWHDR